MMTSDAIWFAKGHELLKAGRFDAITVDELCRRTEKTKGSFYHHFGGIEAYKKALLDTWEESHTREPIRASGRESGQKRYDALRKALRSLDWKLERTMRAWATVDSTARQTCGRIDSQRIAHLAECFPKLTVSEARKQARIEYATLLGKMFLFDARGEM